VKLIAGLGNPGPRYAESRHNVGFGVVDRLARRWNVDLSGYERRFEGVLGEAQAAGQRVLLLKPATYMNLSGKSVAGVWRYYKLALEDLMVVYDDLDLPVGQVRVRAAGSAGGHKGIADVLRHCGSDAVARVRIGIDKVHASATTEYVLGRFRPDEQPLIDAAIETAADACQTWLREGIEPTMNRYNRKRKRTSDTESAAEGESS
jgi:PTH1 family peptidyl-tRNA hydrolase